MTASNQNSAVVRILLTLVLLGMACVLLQRILTVNMAYHALSLNDENERWQRNSADFLIRKAAQAVDAEPDRALAYARQALMEKPVDARIYLYSGLAYDAAKKTRQSELMMNYAHLFGPRMTDNQLMLADFWARHGDTVQTLRHLSAALEMRRALQAKLFPLLHQLAEMQASSTALQTLLTEPPSWWPAFFNYALQHANDTVINRLYLARAQTNSQGTQQERQLYIDYLIRQQKSLEAYALWLSGLTSSQMSVLGYVNDGSFNLPASGEGFGWRFNRGRGALINRFEGAGSLSSPSLRIGFYGSKIGSQELVSQYTMLEPGDYAFQSMYKVESLNAGEGVKWTVSCSNGAVLGSGHLLSGTQHWTIYSFRFEVPDAAPCAMQKLTLTTSPGGSRPFDYEGYAWFDEIDIQKAEFVP